MNETYDVIVLGTGLKECVLSGLLAVKGKKVLHLDRNEYYGAETASLNLTNLWKQFRPGQTPNEQYGHNRDWNVDLIPKFIMANGVLVKMLLHTKVTKYLEWKCVDASYVVQHQKAGLMSKEKMALCKVPATEMEAIKSSLLSLFEKKRMVSFYQYLENVEPEKQDTWKKLDLVNCPMKDVFKKYNLAENTIDFLGHAVALYTNDSYLDQPAMMTVEKMQLYLESTGRYGDSPFLYPIYGLGGLPEAFSRLCAIHGGTYMLNTQVDEILTGMDGKVTGIRSGENTAMAPLVVCDPSYVTPDRIQAVGKVIRAICLMDHPIPGTKDVQSIQIILPSKQMGRTNDMYISMVSYSHLVCKKGMYVAIISTTVETDNPEAEIGPAIEFLGPVLEMFISVTDQFVPVAETTGEATNLWVSSSYDATSHFESASMDVLHMYEKIVGEKLDLNIEPDEDDENY